MPDSLPAISGQPRMTQAARMLLRALATPGTAWYGKALADETGLGRGTVYPLLARFERAGWVSARMEDQAAATAAKRRARRYCKLTEAGRVAALEARARHGAHQTGGGAL